MMLSEVNKNKKKVEEAQNLVGNKRWVRHSDLREKLEKVNITFSFFIFSTLTFVKNKVKKNHKLRCCH